MLQETSKREREAGELSVKREIAAIQSDAASLLSAAMPKKACVGRVDDSVSTDGVASVDNSLGFETVARKHHRVLPQQQDIHAQRWLHVLECARSMGVTYKCPNPKDIGGDLLNVNVRQELKDQKSQRGYGGSGYVWAVHVLGRWSHHKKWPCSTSWCSTVTPTQLSLQLKTALATFPRQGRRMHCSLPMC